MSIRQDEMKILKSINSEKALFLFLAVFLSSVITEVPCDFSYDLQKVTVIGNVTHPTNSYAENGPRTKHNILGIIFKNQSFCVNSLISKYSYMCMDSCSPRNVHLPTKSDRAPPETIYS